jgi:hypothetical protein
VLLADLLGEATGTAFMLFGDRVRSDRADQKVGDSTSAERAEKVQELS